MVGESPMPDRDVRVAPYARRGKLYIVTLDELDVLLRTRYGYQGELRAVGALTRDHLFFLERVRQTPRTRSCHATLPPCCRSVRRRARPPKPFRR